MNYQLPYQEYHLRVSDFATLTGSTRDTLRHYYEIGLLIPRIDPDNGYHYYASSQLTSYYFITMFRQMGCSLSEIKELMHANSKDIIVSACQDKMEAMRQEMIHIRQRMASLENSLWLLERYDTSRSLTPFLDCLPSLSLFRTRVSSATTAHHASDLGIDLKRHIDAASQIHDLSAFPIGTTIQTPSLLINEYPYHEIFSISHSPADLIHTFPLPSSQVISCYHDHTCGDIRKTYQKIMDFATEKKLTICSDLHIISLVNIYGLEQNHTYFKYLFLCVTPPDCETSGPHHL